ncbi:MAG: ATP-dependent DNA ligase [Candidatus Bathyarchaeia archaeon]
MLYSRLVEAYSELEETTGRLAMIDILVNLFRETPPEVIDKVIYLTQGKLHPDWMGLPELGLAEKMATKAIAMATGYTSSEVAEDLKEIGDIGAVAEKRLSQRRIGPIAAPPLTVEMVYDELDAISRESGPGSSERKIKRLSGLLTKAKPDEVRYILRIITGHLRLGVGDMTALDALAVGFATKKHRPILERAYNLSSDLGQIASLLAKKGIDAVRRIRLTPGRPVLMMLAQRLSTAEEIVEKLGGSCSSEYKLDGERMQVHRMGEKIMIFSRRLENITDMYPDIVGLCRQHLRTENTIVEGECVAIDLGTDELRPFQVLMRRRRKYRIKEMMREIPVGMYLFDCLYVDGEDLTNQPYLVRRARLREIVEESERFLVTPALESGDPNEIMTFFHDAISNGCEGLIVKSTSPESIYRAGARSWLWVKLKRSYQSKMIEPVDLAIVGAFMGRGRRAGTYGALLGAVYDKDTDTFQTICKIGSGWTDEVLASMPSMFKPHKIDHKHPRVNSILKADVWFTPSVVTEVIGDEITISSVHTCALDKIQKGAGLGIRFPRFTGRWRKDKSPEEATTVQEIIDMYKEQLKPKR